ncbi:hypothetical protein EBB07_14475 [Paenibacillaceae bacterium]|nr:hypothetical protein EBB07_14475 [Paenibacillaceae bacterium]
MFKPITALILLVAFTGVSPMHSEEVQNGNTHPDKQQSSMGTPPPERSEPHTNTGNPRTDTGNPLPEAGTSRSELDSPRTDAGTSRSELDGPRSESGSQPLSERGASPAPAMHTEIRHADSRTPLHSLTFQTVNGIDLDDGAAAIKKKLGKPAAIEEDRWFPEQEAHHYDHITIGYSDSVLSYLSVTAEQGPLVVIGDDVLPLDMKALVSALGVPDYVAEDGLVYVQGARCLKLFHGTDRDELESIQVYWLDDI